MNRADLIGQVEQAAGITRQQAAYAVAALDDLVMAGTLDAVLNGRGVLLIWPGFPHVIEGQAAGPRPPWTAPTAY